MKKAPLARITHFTSVEPLEARIAPATITVYSLAQLPALGPGHTTLAGAISLVSNLNTSTTPDTIVFAHGLAGTMSLTLGELPVITKPVTIEGPGSNKIIINANGDSRIFDIDTGTSSVPVTISGLALINGDTVTGGSGTQGGGNNPGDGGAIFCAGTLTLKGCVISGNSASAGGGVYQFGDTVTVKNCLIAGNSSSNSEGLSAGGLTLGADKSLVVTGCTISGNTCGSIGGGLIACLGEGGTVLTISKDLFVGNTAADKGGGLWVHETSPVPILTPQKVLISSSTISGNSVTAIGSEGGGIYADTGAISFTKDNVRDNTAAGGGGGIYASRFVNSVTITGGSITGNIASGEGGGFYLKDASGFGEPVTISGAHITDNNSSNNSTGMGGGISLIDAGVVKLSGDTIAGNTSGNSGGGLWDSGSTSTTISGSVFANNASLHGSGGGFEITDGTTVDLQSTKITGNSASSGGGGGGLGAGTSITASNLTVTGNDTGGGGGGIFFAANGGATPTLTAKGDTFSGNDATDNGGGFFLGSVIKASVTGAIVTGNAAFNGGGIYNGDTGTGASLTITGSSITGNVAVINPNIG
jgi:predicted outer membrane repeat protein